MAGYSLKKILQSENTAPKRDLLEEGFWTDLAVTLASGGPKALQQMAQNKLQSFLGKFGEDGEVQTDATLDMIARFKKMGLKNMWGQDLGKLEKQLQIRKTKGKKKESAKELLAAFLKSEDETMQAEGSDPFKGHSLASVFLDD